ncbi:MAG: hypothetical protein QOF51_1377 [Chloroflexota bacterium]|jgi:hypothetical protein|nr:hypothetical protein [Chloroflexota bacterium]
MSEELQLALKKAVVAALAAGVTVFLKEYTRERERLERESGQR